MKKLWKVKVNRLGWDIPKTLYAESREAAAELAAMFPASDPVKYAGQYDEAKAQELTEWSKTIAAPDETPQI